MKANPEVTCVASDVVLLTEDRVGYAAPPGRTLASPSPKRRVLDHLSDYRFSYFYGIQRSRQLSIALSAVAAATDCSEFVSHPNLAAGYELGMELCGAALGALSNSPDALLLKRVGNESRGAEDQGSNEWLDDPDAQEAVAAWRAILSEHLAPHIEVPVMTVDGWIEEALDLFCQTCLRHNLESKKGRKVLVSKIATALRPKTKLDRDSRKWVQVTHSVHSLSFKALRASFRATMKLIGRPRNSAFTFASIDRVDPHDLEDVVSILDENFGS